MSNDAKDPARGKNSEGHAELRAGDHVELNAIVLGQLPLKESDKLVHLMTMEVGRIAAVAKGAAKSTKRFGAALEPFNYIKAHLKVPKVFASGESSLWILEKADAKSSFAHLKKSYAGIESSFFISRMIMDLVPEGVVDTSLFKALGRFLRDSEGLAFELHSGWARVAFWDWFSKHFGYGVPSSVLADRWTDTAMASLEKAWNQGLDLKEPDFLNLFKVLSLVAPQDLSLNEQISLYQKWVDISGLHWEHFEKWVASKKYT